MHSADALNKLVVLYAILGLAWLADANFASASAQTALDRPTATVSQNLTAANRAVGVRGRLKQVYWTSASEQDLGVMRLYETAQMLSSAPGAMARSKIWTARADVCGLPGDEILVQIRSPLTCGTLGCEMMVMSDAGGAPRVLLRTVGDSIDSDRTDELVINRGSKRQRAWKYRGDRFQQMRRR